MTRHRMINCLVGFCIVAIMTGTIWVHASSEEKYYEGGTFLGYLRLPTSNVNLGPLRVDPTDPRGRRTYFEAVDIMTVTYKCDKAKHGSDRPKFWEVRIAGDDFRNGSDVIPISQMRWKIPGSTYRNMPAQGDWESIDDSTYYKGKERYAEHIKPISLYLPLTNDEYAGTYQATFYATLIFF